MLSTADLAAMRATLSASLPDTADIGRYLAVKDSALGQTVTWPVATADEDVPCRLSPVSQNVRRAELIEGQKLTAEADWIVTFASTVTVSEKDHLTIGGAVYEVAAVFGQRSWNLGSRVLCRLVR